MSDTENSDDERYANESFENESDNEVPEMSEIESETSENSDESDGDDDEDIDKEEDSNDDDEDEDDLPSVKLNTGPIKRNNFLNNFTNIHKADAVPFASSSDEEDDVVVGQTLAEINTPSTQYIDEQPELVVRSITPIPDENNHHFQNVIEASSDEISEEENNEEDEEAEFKRIQDMEEKYIQQNSAKTPKPVNIGNNSINIEDERKEEEYKSESEEQESDIEDEDIEVEEEIIKDENNANVIGNINGSDLVDSLKDNNSNMEVLRDAEILLKEQSLTALDQNNLVQVIERNSEEDTLKTSQILQIPLLDENFAKTFDLTDIINSEQITMVNVQKTSDSGNIHSKSDTETLSQLEKKTSEIFLESDNKQQDDHTPTKQKQRIETEKIQNNSGVVEACKESYYNDDAVVCYNDHFNYHITSQTPTSFNSDDYIFHANIIKQFHRTTSTDKLRAKPHPRKSMSFSNERMREIERHNQILLRKILNSKPSQSSLQKWTSTQTSLRLTTSAVNRKKQQRQINLDNQILKRKIETIALRRRPLIS